MADNVKSYAKVKITCTAPPSSAKPVISSQATRLVRHDFPHLYPDWQLLIILSMIYLKIASMKICSVTLSGTEVRLDRLVVPWLLLLAFLGDMCDICFLTVPRNLLQLPWTCRYNWQQPCMHGWIPPNPMDLCVLYLFKYFLTRSSLLDWD